MLALYGHLFSSYTWKALIALYANGTAFEFREIGAGHDAANQLIHTAHPGGQFPVLTDGGRTVIEATAIIEYLAVHHPGPAPLIPADPAVAVETRMLDRVFDNYFQRNFQRIVSAYIASYDGVGETPSLGEPDVKEVEAGKAGLRRAYAWLERWLGGNNPPPHVSLFSCSAAPALFYADWCEPIPADCPRVAALRAEVLALPPVVRCVDDARPFRSYFPPGAPDRD